MRLSWHHLNFLQIIYSVENMRAKIDTKNCKMFKIFKNKIFFCLVYFNLHAQCEVPVPVFTFTPI